MDMAPPSHSAGRPARARNAQGTSRTYRRTPPLTRWMIGTLIRGGRPQHAKEAFRGPLHTSFPTPCQDTQIIPLIHFIFAGDSATATSPLRKSLAPICMAMRRIPPELSLIQ